MRRRLLRAVLPLTLVIGVAHPRSAPLLRISASALLLGLWSAVYVRYRRWGKATTAQEYELLRTANWDAFVRHYNERVPTIEEEFSLWGAYHQHRHEMRYDIVAGAVREQCPPGGTILDLGCGAGLVADRIEDLQATYVGLDLPEHHIHFAAEKFGPRATALRTMFVRGDAERIPLRDASVDVVVFSEVIEHLLRPELSVWEISRLLRSGGVLVMTTNNASEMPLRSPLTHLFPWLEKAFGFHRPGLISLRPWVWPEAVHESLLPPGSDPVYLPHTHHIQAETRALFSAAGLDTLHSSTFEFPPPQAATSAWLDRHGHRGRQAVDIIERVCRALPLVRRLGCHVLMIVRKSDRPVPSDPPPGVWPGPFSDSAPVPSGQSSNVR